MSLAPISLTAPEAPAGLSQPIPSQISKALVLVLYLVSPIGKTP